jgi:L-galactose dehydrogenase
MQYTQLGRTGLKVSIMGIGCGGHSRLGMAYGATPEQAANIVRAGVDLGCNFIDTAESYGTESAVGLAIAPLPRDSVILSTKAGVDWQGRRSTPAELQSRLDASLRRLGTDYVDIYHLHGVSADDYPYARDELRPAVARMIAAGKVRFAGITEAFAPDPAHRMLAPAVRDDPALWDVVMVGHNFLNPSARHRILPHTRKHNIGTLCMFAVRRALSQPAVLAELVGALAAEGRLDLLGRTVPDALAFLADTGITQAAYRFARHEPGIDLVLSGTGNLDHLRENARTLLAPRLPDATLAELGRLFGHLDFLSGN